MVMSAYLAAYFYGETKSNDHLGRPMIVASSSKSQDASVGVANSATAPAEQNFSVRLQGLVLSTDKAGYEANVIPKGNGDGNVVIKVTLQNQGDGGISVNMDSCEGLALGLDLQKNVDGSWRQAGVESGQLPCHIGPMTGNTVVGPHETVAETVSDEALIPSSTYRFILIGCGELGNPGDQCSDNDQAIINSNIFTTRPQPTQQLSGVVVSVRDPSGVPFGYGIKTDDGRVLEMESDSVDVADVIVGRYLNKKVFLFGYTTGALWHGIAGYLTEVDGGFYVLSMQSES